MKKTAILFVVLLSAALLVACVGEAEKTPAGDGGETVLETVTETAAETENDVPKKEEPIRMSEDEKAKYFKVVEFDLPEADFRDVIVDEMRKYASIEWVASEDFGMNAVIGNNDWTVNLTYKKGVKYTGLPYTNYFVSFLQFEEMVVDGKYAPEKKGWKEAPGMDCWSSIRCAMQQFYPVEGWTADWVPGQKTFSMQTVGSYKAPESPQSTQAICEYNGKDIMFESYMELKKGDILYRKDFGKQDYLHCRVVVEDPDIVKNGAGKVIPSRSSIKTIEQTNQFDKRSDGVNTTWYVDHVYSLEALYDTDYVPLTVSSYSTPLSEMQVPYILLDKEITASVLAKGTFNSTVKSNFPLRFVQIDVLDKTGKTVLSMEHGGLQDVFSYVLRNKFIGIFEELTDGTEYTFVLSAGISAANTELARVDFTYNG